MEDKRKDGTYSNGRAKKYLEKSVAVLEEKPNKQRNISLAQLEYIKCKIYPPEGITTKNELAKYLGVSSLTLRNWEKDERFQKLKEMILEEFLGSKGMVQDTWLAMYKSATRNEKENPYAGQMVLSRFDPLYKKAGPSTQVNILSISTDTINSTIKNLKEALVEGEGVEVEKEIIKDSE